MELAGRPGAEVANWNGDDVSRLQKGEGEGGGGGDSEADCILQGSSGSNKV
jgi:hypothetical protein